VAAFTNEPGGARRLRVLAAAALLALQAGGLGVALWGSRAAPTPTMPPGFGHGPAPDLIATLEYFADDALEVTTAHGLRTMRLDARTTVQTVAGAGRLADLRPGMALALWLRPGTPRSPVVERVGLLVAVPE
jgi:hypothetical protein